MNTKKFSRRDWLKVSTGFGLWVSAPVVLPLYAQATNSLKKEAIDIGKRRELFVDEYLIDQWQGKAELRLHHPVPREVVLETDKAWEGNHCGAITVFRDGELFRMYYMGLASILEDNQFKSPHPRYTCLAESEDGIHWHRPELGLIEFSGSKKNNIIWEDESLKGSISPFKDTNPAAAQNARYKGFFKRQVIEPRYRQLFALRSSDGIHWQYLQDEPIITKGVTKRAFDGGNQAFWDQQCQCYRAYIRDWRDRKRGVKTVCSKDFVNWSNAEWLKYMDSHDWQLYTNNIMPYPRAPHIYVGFPTRYIEREWSPTIEALPELQHRRMRSRAKERLGTALTDGLFMSSRDGTTFNLWDEAFLRPGPQITGNWMYGDNYQNLGLVTTKSNRTGAPDELSIYVNENSMRGHSTLFRRHTLRVDGFVSVHAAASDGGIVTRPLIFRGNRLTLNFSTSAAGNVRVELQEANGRPISGYSLSDSSVMIGDSLEYTVHWGVQKDVSKFAGKPVRLRFVLWDADLYSFQFK